MFKKVFTIVIIPRRTRSVKKLKISKNLFRLMLILLIVLFVGLVYLVLDYVSIRADLRRLVDIENRYKGQENKIEEFSSRYKSLQLHLENLEALNEKLRAMAGQRTDDRPKSQPERADEYQKKLEIAREKGVLETISTEQGEIDIDLLHIKEQRFQNLAAFFKETRIPLYRIPQGWPVTGYITNEFGINRDPYTGESKSHPGIDISTRNFHPVYAPADGIVTEIKTDEYFGNVLEIDHGNGFITRYGHLARFEVKEGDLVHKGRIIAQAGLSGHTTGPRLRYEILLYGIPQNPVIYILD